MNKLDLFEAYMKRCSLEKTIKNNYVREGKYITRIRAVDIISTINEDLEQLNVLSVKCYVIDSLKDSYYVEGEDMYWNIPMTYENYLEITNFLSACPPMFSASSLLTTPNKETAAWNCCLLLAVKETKDKTEVQWFIDKSVMRMGDEDNNDKTIPF